jgi:DNA polymerase-3 subunit beta
MKIEINRSVLMTMVKEINDIIMSNNYIFALRGILFNIKKNEIEIIGSSNNISVIKKVKDLKDVNIIEEGSVLVKSSLLYEILNKLKNEKLLFSTTESNLLTIKDSNTNFEISTINVESFPLPNIDNSLNAEFKIKGKLFKKYLKTACASVEEFSNNQIYKSVNIASEKNKLTFASTDSFRITKINTNIKVIGELNQMINIRTIRDIIKVMSDVDEFDIKLSNKSIRIESKNIFIQGKVINQLFHNIEKIMELENKNNLIIKKSELNSLIDKVTTISGQLSTAVKLIISSKELTIKTSERELGKAKATTKDIKFDSNDKIEISLNAKYINEIVKVLDSENIIIRIENGSTPI